MSDRLTELQRQRALAQEQLAWFDREIARETGRAPATASPAAAPAIPVVPVVMAPKPSAMADTAALQADEILARYRDESKTSPADVKKGCYLWFICALGMFAICVVAIYVIYRETK